MTQANVDSNVDRLRANFNRDGGIRTRDPLNPISVRGVATAGSMPAVPSGVSESAGVAPGTESDTAGRQRRQQRGQRLGVPTCGPMPQRSPWRHPATQSRTRRCRTCGEVRAAGLFRYDARRFRADCRLCRQERRWCLAGHELRGRNAYFDPTTGRLHCRPCRAAAVRRYADRQSGACRGAA